MKYDKYIKLNEQVRKAAKRLGVDYIRQYSYKGPNITRTKLWGARGPMHKINKLLRRLNKMSGIKSAVYNPPFKARTGNVDHFYTFQPDIKVCYKVD